VFRKHNQAKVHFMPHLYRTVILLIICTFILFIFIVNRNFAKHNEQRILDFNRSALQGVKNRVSGQCDEFLRLLNDSYMSYFVYNDELFHVLSTGPETYDERKIIYRFLDTGFFRSPEMVSFSLFLSSNDYVYSATKTKRSHYPAHDSINASLLDTYNSHITKLSIHPSSLPPFLQTDPAYSLLFCIRDVVSKKNIGAIQADYSINELNQYILNNYAGVTGDFLLLDDDDNILYDSSNIHTPETFQVSDDLLKTAHDQTIDVNLNGQRYFMTTDKISYPAITIVGLVEKSDISASIYTNFIIMFIALTSITILLSVGVALYLQKSTQQLVRIHASMTKVQQGDLNAYIKTIDSQSDELYDISVAFNKMLENLNLHITNEYTAQLDAERYRFRMLQSQINPHFLYNTLEAIRMKALLVHQEEVGEMVMILSKIFRSCIKAEGITTIRQEIDNCNLYLRLCHLQYGERLTYHLDVQPDIMNCKIMQYSMLVLVENFVLHGFDSGKNDNILHLKCFEEDGFVYISSQDNGYGMTRQQLTALQVSLESEASTTPQKLGLRNIYQRTLIAFEGKAHIDISSKENQGLSVVLSFPKVSYLEQPLETT